MTDIFNFSNYHDIYLYQQVNITIKLIVCIFKNHIFQFIEILKINKTILNQRNSLSLKRIYRQLHRPNLKFILKLKEKKHVI